MSEFPYGIRNYGPEDFEGYVRLRAEIEKLEPTGHCPSLQSLSKSLSRPNYSPGCDLFVVERAGSIVGYLDVTPELGIGRVILDCSIHPQHRRKRLAT